MFSAPLALEAGEVVDRDGFVFADFEEAVCPTVHA
jgi:hypothetical protein